jgi:Fe-S cluster assembly ATP-binding protein
MIEIKNLHARVDDKEILKGLSLTIPDGEVHAIMGPNGAGKSTLANVISGKDGYEITEGDILFHGQSVLEMEPEERAHLGLFLAFQYPVEIPGVNSMTFLRTALNAKRKANGEAELDGAEFLRIVKTAMKNLKIKDDFLKRSVNVGFSGGEKKRFEILQMQVLSPTFAVLDETDSGLDIDALKVVAEGVNMLRDPSRSFLAITHYQRLLDYIEPDVVHILADGKIQKTGDKNLALELEEKGYDAVIGDAA